MQTNLKTKKIIDGGMQLSLLLLALSAPVSIAATQTAWGLAILFWLAGLIFQRPSFRRSGFDLAVLAFVGLTLISSFFSYEPAVSLGKMAAVSLVTIVYLVSTNVKTKRVYQLAILLLASCFVASCFAMAKQIVGNNLKVIQLTADSPLREAGVAESYTILKANGIDVNSPAELNDAIWNHSTEGTAVLMVYRHELIDNYKLSLSKLQPGVEGLGITEWYRGHDTRASGFYGQFITFAEALQLIASLALGLLIVAPGRIFGYPKILLAAALAAYGIALFLTITRASALAFLVSAGLMVLIGASRRTIIILMVIAIPVALAGLFYMQQKREVGFIDTRDESTNWRLMVWREGFDLLISNPRHLAVGIGMDSIKKHYLEWHMFDDGRQPVGHMHSTPLQFALERGVPTLIAWLIWMALYLKLLWRNFRRRDLNWFSRGILLGALGGTVGFITSGLVHYNWGDSEVIMIFYLIMGLSLAIIRNMDSADPAKADA